MAGEHRRSVMTQQASQPRDWISGTKTYQDLVYEFRAQDPALRHRDTLYPIIPFNDKEQIPRILVLCLAQNGAWEKPGVRTIDALSQHFEGPESPAATKCTAYIIEAPGPDIIRVLGSHFSIEASFFMRHESPVVYTSEHSRVHDTVRLPSQLDREDNFQVKYYEMLHLGRKPKDFYMHCARTARHIGITRLNDDYQQTVIARRKCSFWSRRNADKGWDAVILCDPPINEVWIHAPGEHVQIEPVSPEPFQRGYASFVKNSAMPAQSPQDPPRTSMLDDIEFYFENHFNILQNHNDPQVASFFMKKIAASHYVQLVAYTASILSNRQWPLSRQNSLKELERFTKIEKAWSDLEGLHRRCCEYIEDVEAALLSLGIPISRPEPLITKSWDDDADFQYIHMRLNDCKGRTEMMISSITGLASMIGTSQTLNEAQRSLLVTKSAQTLSLVGLLFIPLAYVAGIFSMPGNYAPGASDFVKYWEVAAPLALGLFLLAMLFELGYDDHAKWRLSTFAEKFGYKKKADRRSGHKPEKETGVTNPIGEV